MTPDTVHYLAQVIRHQRGMVTAMEKWASSQSFSPQEVAEASRFVRRVLNAFERSLGSVEVTK